MYFRQWRRWNGLLSGIIIVYLGFLPPCANGEQTIAFGTTAYHADSREWKWIEEHARSGFLRPDEVFATLSIEQKMLALYSQTRTSVHLVFLSVFEQGHERVLWKTKIAPEASIRLWNPVLLSTSLTADTSPDILMSYWPHKISTAEGRFQTQSLLLFLNWKEATEEAIPLSMLDFALGESATDVVSYHAYQQLEDPAKQRYSLVLLVPATKNVPFSLYVWSRSEQYKSPEGGREILYELSEYQLNETQLVKTRDIHEQHYEEISSLRTAELLKTTIKTAQHQGQKPIFLDFDMPGELALCTEDEWFAKMEEWGKRGLD